MLLPPYAVIAVNTTKASENKIHDDATAQRFGFRGGFVGGVNVYAYMAHQPVRHWGRAWLECGTGEARFGKPVYEGEVAEVSAVPDVEGLALAVTSQGVHCASGRAGPPGSAGPAPPLVDFPLVAPRTERVTADAVSLAVGDWLGMAPLQMTEARHRQDLADLRETDPVYACEGIVHPGTLLRCCNWALIHNVILPAWIHMGSSVRNLGLARVGDTLNVRARITRNYEHKGHQWVELDALVVADETRPLIRATHTAIYHPRQVSEAA
jgi:acyl dehydratase